MTDMQKDFDKIIARLQTVAEMEQNINISLMSCFKQKSYVTANFYNLALVFFYMIPTAIIRHILYTKILMSPKTSVIWLQFLYDSQ
jgi:hypothetical protein